MTFEDHIKEAFETLTARLHGEIERQVQQAVAELSAAAQADRERAASEERSAANDIEIAAAAARLQAHDEGRDAGKDEGLRQGVAEGREQAEREGRDALNAAVAAATEQGRREGAADGRQQAEREGRDALEAAVAAAKEDGRREGAVEGWQDAEQEGRRALDAAVTAAVGAAQAGAKLEDAGATGRLAAAVHSIDAARSLAEILDTLVHCASEHGTRAGVWLVRGSRVSSWRMTGFGPDLDNDLQWHDDAGLIAEAARTNAVVRGDADSLLFAGMPPARTSLAVPVALSGQVVAVLYADDGPSTLPAQHLNPDAIEVLTKYGARCLEALTAFKVARALTERPDRPDATSSPTAVEASAEDDVSAKRYARLLVSEIKLYHESAVIDGRRDRDLATRLGGEITRARVLYEQRVPQDVRQRTDFFRDELVRTLAGGDASLL